MYFADAVMGFVAAVGCAVLSTLNLVAVFAPQVLELFAGLFAPPVTNVGTMMSEWRLGLAVLFALAGVLSAWHYYRVFVAIAGQSVDALVGWLPEQQKRGRWFWLLSVTGVLYGWALLWGYV